MSSSDAGVRRLLYILMVLVALGLASNFYLASQLDRNSEELAAMRILLQRQMMGTALTQAEELQKRMDSLNESAAGIDAKMQKAQEEMDARLRKAQDDFVARMNTELPKMMDNYLKSRAKGLESVIPQRLREVVPQAPATN